MPKSHDHASHSEGSGVKGPVNEEGSHKKELSKLAQDINAKLPQSPPSVIGQNHQRHRVMIEKSGVQKKTNPDRLLLSAIRSTIPHRHSFNPRDRFESPLGKLPLSPIGLLPKHAEGLNAARMNDPKVRSDVRQHLIGQNSMDGREQLDVREQQQRRWQHQLPLDHSKSLQMLGERELSGHPHNPYGYQETTPLHTHSAFSIGQFRGEDGGPVSSHNHQGVFAGFGRFAPSGGVSRAPLGAHSDQQRVLTKQGQSPLPKDIRGPGLGDAAPQDARRTLPSEQYAEQRRLHATWRVLALQREQWKQQQLLQQFLHMRQSLESSSVQYTNEKTSHETSPPSQQSFLHLGRGLRFAGPFPGSKTIGWEAAPYLPQEQLDRQPNVQQQGSHPEIPADLGHYTDPATDHKLRQMFEKYGF